MIQEIYNLHIFQRSIWKRNTYIFIRTIFNLFWAVSRFTIREQTKDNGIMSELGISPVYRHDTGFFKCTGSNYYGQDENSIELIVQGLWYILITNKLSFV